MTEIYQSIIQQLRNIESEENVRILYACESGSRAWGFHPRIVIMMSGFCMFGDQRRIFRFLNQEM